MHSSSLRQSFYFLILAIVFSSFFLTPYCAYASVLSIKTPSAVSVGDRVAVDVLVDPEDVSINSIAGIIVFSPEMLSFVGFSATHSSVPLWVEEPKETKKGAVLFSGVIPGGLERLYDPLNTSNKAIPVVRLFFIAKKEGISFFSFDTSSILRNDGKGTPTRVQTVPTSLLIKKTKEYKTVDVVLSQDTTAPHPFSVSIIERSLFGKTPRLAVFSTTDDSEGGIDRYEISIGDLHFIRAVSPYPLPHRLFSYVLTVRAFDYSGNMREQQINVPAERAIIDLIPLCILVGIGVGFFLIRFYNRKRT